jgi:hypothetical protein
MRRAGAALAAVMLAAAVDPSAASAQTCQGLPPLEFGRFNIGAAAAAYTYATALTGSITAGGRLHGTVTGGRVRDAEMLVSAHDVGGRLGYDLGLEADRRILLCPTLALTRTYGPSDYALTARYFERRDAEFGVGAAAVALQTDRLRIVPYAGVSVHALRVSRSRAGSGDIPASTKLTWNTKYRTVRAGVGVILNDRYTLRPALNVPFGLAAVGQQGEMAVPFGREERELSLSVTVGVALGRRSASPET